MKDILKNQNPCGEHKIFIYNVIMKIFVISLMERTNTVD